MCTTKEYISCSCWLSLVDSVFQIFFVLLILSSSRNCWKSWFGICWGSSYSVTCSSYGHRSAQSANNREQHRIPNIAPFIGGISQLPVCRLITVDCFHHKRGSFLFLLECVEATTAWPATLLWDCPFSALDQKHPLYGKWVLGCWVVAWSQILPSY